MIKDTYKKSKKLTSIEEKILIMTEKLLEGTNNYLNILKNSKFILAVEMKACKKK